MDEESSGSEIQVREKANVTMRCRGKGFPEPRIIWKREDAKMIKPDQRHPGGCIIIISITCYNLLETCKLKWNK